MRFNSRFLKASIVSAGVALLLWPAFENGSVAAAQETPEVEILHEEAKNLYHRVPDVEILLPDRKKVHLSELWSDKPLLITLFFNRCTGTCSPFLRSLKSAVDKNGGLGDDYRVVSLSFDPKDTLKDVASWAATTGIQEGNKWLVGIAEPKDIARISDAIGFWYKLDPTTGQFDHPSLVAAVRDGKVVRVLLGNFVKPVRLKELLFELKGIFVPIYSRPGENVLFRCLQVDEASGTVRLSWGMVLLFAPGLMALLIAALIFRRNRKALHAAPLYRK